MLVSDGYGITVIQLPYRSMDCCTLVNELCAEANRCLQQTGDVDVEFPCCVKGHDSHSLVAAETPHPDEQFTSTQELSATASSFVLSDLDASQGVIQFAGIDLEHPPMTANQPADRKNYAVRLCSALLTAWALILSDGKRRIEKGDDGRPVIHKGSLKDEICYKLLDTLAVAWGLQEDSDKHSIQLLRLQRHEATSLFRSLLNLVRLDSVRQQRLELVLKMVRTYVASRLAQPFMDKHLDQLEERIRLLVDIRELLQLSDKIIADTYSWKSFACSAGQRLKCHVRSWSPVADIFVPFMVQSEIPSIDLGHTVDTKVPSCWTSVYCAAKSVSIHLLSQKSSHGTDSTEFTTSEKTFGRVMKSAFELYATVSGDVQHLGLDVTVESNSNEGSRQFLEEQLKQQIEALKSSKADLRVQNVFRATAVSEGLVTGSEYVKCDGDQFLSTLLLHFQRYDVRSALLLVDSVLQVNSFYLDLSVSGDSSELDELHRLRHFAQARSGSVPHRRVKPADLLNLLPVLSVETASRVTAVRCMAQLMAAYFANLPLLVAPSHSPALSLSLRDLIQGPSGSDGVRTRFSELSRDVLLEAMKEQGVTDCWTVYLTVELFLACGLLNDTVWFVYKLGDWRTAFSLSTVLSHHCRLSTTSQYDIDLNSETLIMEPLERYTHVRELKEAVDLLLGECQCYHIQVDEGRVGRPHIERIRQLVKDTDTDDFCPNYRKIQNVLHAAAVAGLDVMTYVACQLLVCLKRLVWASAWSVPAGFDLPAPPPYCPQFWQLKHDSSDEVVIDTGFRLLVHLVVTSLVALLKAGRCLQSCILAYIEKLGELFVTQSKSPSHLKVFRKSCALLDDSVVSDVSPVAVVFRELCGLLWLLHVRDQLAQQLREPRDTTPQVRVSDTLRWFGSALQFERYLTDSDVLKKAVFTVLLDVGVSKSIASFIGRHFADEITVQKESRYKEELNQLLAAVGSVSNLAGNGSPDDGQPLLATCRREAESRKLCLHSLVQTYGTVNTFMGTTPDVTSSFTRWNFDVGSWECESHRYFAKFLDSCFELMLAQGSPQKPHDGQTQSPLLPSLHQLHSIPSQDGTPGLWPQLIPLIFWLQKWSSRGVRRLAVPGVESKIERSQSSQSSIKVSLTVESITSALFLREQEFSDGAETDRPVETVGKMSVTIQPSLSVDSNSDIRSQNVRSEGEVTMLSGVGSLSSIDITGFGEAVSREVGGDADTESAISMVFHQDQVERPDEFDKLQLLRLDGYDLLKQYGEESVGLKSGDSFDSNDISLPTEQEATLEEFQSKDPSVSTKEEGIAVLSTSPPVATSLPVSGEREEDRRSSSHEVVSSISVTGDKNIDAESGHALEQVHHHDVDVGSDSHISVHGGSNAADQETREADFEHPALTSNLSEKEQSFVLKDDVGSPTLLSSSVHDQSDHESNPLISVTRTIPGRRDDPSSTLAEEKRSIPDTTTLEIGTISGRIPPVFSSGVVESAVVQQSLAQQPFNRNELHRILQVIVSCHSEWEYVAHVAVCLLVTRLRDRTLNRSCQLWSAVVERHASLYQV